MQIRLSSISWIARLIISRWVPPKWEDQSRKEEIRLFQWEVPVLKTRSNSWLSNLSQLIKEVSREWKPWLPVVLLKTVLAKLEAWAMIKSMNSSLLPTPIWLRGQTSMICLSQTCISCKDATVQEAWDSIQSMHRSSEWMFNQQIF